MFHSTFDPLYVLRVPSLRLPHSTYYVTLTPSLAPTKVGARSVFATWLVGKRLPSLRTTSALLYVLRALRN